MIQKYKLQNGIHDVTITQACYGEANGYGINYRYLSLKFENDNGYFYTKVFLHQNSEVILDILYNRVGLDRTKDDVNNLIGKQLKIEPIQKLYDDNNLKTFVKFYHENNKMSNNTKQIGPDTCVKRERSEGIVDFDREVFCFF